MSAWVTYREKAKEQDDSRLKWKTVNPWLSSFLEIYKKRWLLYRVKRRKVNSKIEQRVFKIIILRLQIKEPDFVPKMEKIIKA